MQTKLDIGDNFILRDNRVVTIKEISITNGRILYCSGNHDAMAEEDITGEYINTLEKNLEFSKKTLDIMKQKLNQK